MYIKNPDPKLIKAIAVVGAGLIIIMVLFMKDSIYFDFTKDQFKEIQFQTEYKGKILEYNKEHGMYYFNLGKNKVSITHCWEMFADYDSNYKSIREKLSDPDSLFKAANNDTLFVFSEGKRDTILLKFDNEIKKK
jgi:hypothetical protein